MNSAPSDRHFGWLVGFAFLVTGVYFWLSEQAFVSTVMLFFSASALLAVKFVPRVFSRPKTIWMKFGYLLGRFVSPMVLGVLFFLIFTPLGMGLRFLGRDELDLKTTKANTIWQDRSNTLEKASLKLQF
jgi:hypothetical protein